MTTVMSNIIHFDRSRIETWQTCPRKRWWAYEYQGRGLERVKLNVPMLSGSEVHHGIEQLLKSETVDAAVSAAVAKYTAAVESRGLDVTEAEAAKTVAEQRALIEALIRAWAAVRLEPLRAEYEIIAIEQECHADFDYAGQQLRLMSRPDVVLRRKADGALFIKNFKTVSNPDSRWAEQWRYDMQTLSECLAVEQWLWLENHGYNRLKAAMQLLDGPPKLSGVLIEGLAKGQRLEYPKGSGNWYHNSPLIYCWMKAAAAPFPDEFAPRYEWKDSNGANHRLGKGWRKVPVWEHYNGSVAAWLQHLLDIDRALVEEQFYQVAPILRSDWEIEEWKMMVLPVESEIRDRRTGNIVNQAFPKHSAHGNCIRPSRCPFWDICWGNLSEPLESGLYQLRSYNHPMEAEDNANA